MDSLKRTTSTIAAAAALTLACGGAAAHAAPGALDPSFGTGGITLSAPGAVVVSDLAVQPDGRVLVLESGYDYLHVRRLLADGKPDPTFGSGGAAAPLTFPGYYMRGLALQSDGKIVLAGYNKAGDFAVARLLPGGKLDKSFVGDGVMVDITPDSEEIVDLAIDNDGGILVTGKVGGNALVARYTKYGPIDQGFGQYGRRILDFGADFQRADSVAVQSDGTIVAGLEVNNAAVTPASPDRVVALTPGGKIDTAFGSSGSVTFDGGINSVAVAPGDRVLFAGWSYATGDYRFALGRRNADGSPDASFGGGMVFTTPLAGQDAYVEHVAAAPGGKVVVAGLASTDQSEHRLVVARYGAPDPPSGDTGGTQLADDPVALTNLRLTRRVFAVARRSTRIAGRAQAASTRPRGTKFVYTLNRPAKVTIRIKRLHHRGRARKLTRASYAGRNRVRFTGRIRRHALRPGVYRATLRATDATGALSTRKRVRFRIVRG